MAFINALIFDLDNTLFDRDEAARTVLIEMGLQAHVEAIMQADNGGMSDRLRFAQRVVSIAELDQSPEDFWAEFRDRVAAATPRSPAVRAMLLRLAQHYRIGVLSNGGSANQRAKVQRLGIEDTLHALVISGEHAFRKPDAEAFHHTCQLLTCSPANTLMIGNDYETDVLAARAAGLRALLVGQRRGESAIAQVSDVEEWLLTHARNSAS